GLRGAGRSPGQGLEVAVPAGQELVHVEDVVGRDRGTAGARRVGGRCVGQARLGEDEAEGRAAAGRALDPDEGDVLPGCHDGDPGGGAGLLADGAREAVRERAEVIQRIHPGAVYPFPRSPGRLEADTPGEYHLRVTAADAAPTTDTFRHAYTRDKAQL